MVKLNLYSHFLTTCKKINLFILILFFYTCQYSLTIPIHYFFNLSLCSCIFLKKLKSRFITPLWNNGCKPEVTKYRPISKISFLPKLFEKLIKRKLYDSIKNNLVEEQHSFHKSESTETNWTVFYSYLIDVIKTGSRVNAIYTAHKKTFDTVD